MTFDFNNPKFDDDCVLIKSDKNDSWFIVKKELLNIPLPENRLNYYDFINSNMLEDMEFTDKYLHNAFGPCMCIANDYNIWEPYTYRIEGRMFGSEEEWKKAAEDYLFKKKFLEIMFESP